MNHRYVSNELTHFVGRQLGTPRKQYDLLKTIIETGTLKSGLGDTMSVDPKLLLSSNERVVTGAVCFCDIPVQDRQFHMKKYSQFGLSFKKDKLTSNFGASPVFYIASTAPVKDVWVGKDRGWNSRGEMYDDLANRLRDVIYLAMIGSLASGQTSISSTVAPSTVPSGRRSVPELRWSSMSKEASDLIWLILDFEKHLFSYLVFFDPNLPEGDIENLYMERE